MHAQLAREGFRVSKRRVERIMREHGLVARTRRKVVRTTIADPNAAPAPNLLGRDFSTTGPNQKWVTDLTYVETTEGFVYLSLIQDLFSGRVVGWAMDDSMETDLCVRALQMAIEERRPLPGLVHHSDRGSQYTSHAYRAALDANKMICSMSRRAQCWDNAPAESIFGRIKEELFPSHQWQTKEQARAEIVTYLQSYFNSKRIKKRLGYSCPIDYELRHGLMPLAA
ncbi:MAG: IS3 family transposase [Cytophagaceae bacterium]|nr:MAG: IS3 family transposase [Cytophagaceae bacterium]